MVPSHQDIGIFAEKLYQSQCFDDAFHAFEEQVFRLGFEGALYTFVPRIALDANLPEQPIYKVSESYGANYLSHYAEARFDRQDPIVKAVAAGTSTPLDWWLEVKKGQMTVAERTVIVTAREDYGIVNGVTLPLASDSRGIAGASFISTEYDSLFIKLKAEHLRELMLCAQMFHGVIQGNSLFMVKFLRPLLQGLSRKETAVLRLMAQGKGQDQIARELDTTTRYLDRVMRHLREKISGVETEELPTINRNQLMYFVGLLNLIDLIQ